MFKSSMINTTVRIGKSRGIGNIAESPIKPTDDYPKTHKHFDKMLRGVMPATFAEFKSYPDDFKGSFSGAHRHLDHTLYSSMPANYSEFKSYPAAREGEEKEEERGLEGKTESLWRKHFSPFFSESLLPLKSLGFNENGEAITYEVDTSQFKPKDIKIRLNNCEVRIEAVNDMSKDKDGISKSYKKMIECILVPRWIKSRDISAVLSEDGKLTLSIKRALPVQIPIRGGNNL